jgi:hypothetical protein
VLFLQLGFEVSVPCFESSCLVTYYFKSIGIFLLGWKGVNDYVHMCYKLFKLGAFKLLSFLLF